MTPPIPNRARIVELIRAEPGLRLGTMAKRLDLDYSTVRHHVTRLAADGLVRSTGDGQKRWYAADAAAVQGQAKLAASPGAQLFWSATLGR